MTKFIVELIANVRGDFLDDWESFKEDCPEEIQETLNNFEETGTADIDYTMEDDHGLGYDHTRYIANEEYFRIRGKHNEKGYCFGIATTAVNMYNPDKGYAFALERFDDEYFVQNRLKIQLLVNNTRGNSGWVI